MGTELMICIIGGCGYIGSRVYQDLKSKYPVVTVDLELFGNNVNSKNIKKDFAELPASFYKPFDTIILLAGHSSVPMSLANPTAATVNNVGNFIDLLEKIPETAKFIYASSSSVYHGQTMVNEENRLNKSTNIYDYTKYLIDKIVKYWNGRYYALRLGTVNGSSPNFRTDLMMNKMYVNARTVDKITYQNPDIVRPILGMNDLCRIMEMFVGLDAPRGIYNVCSYNDTVRNMATTAGEILKTGAQETPGAEGYNFSMNTDKVVELLDFPFLDTTEKIVHEMIINQKPEGLRRDVSSYIPL